MQWEGDGDEAKSEVQQEYSVSDADMATTMQWVNNGDTRASVAALAGVALRDGFRDKFFLERRACVIFL